MNTPASRAIAVVGLVIANCAHMFAEPTGESTNAVPAHAAALRSKMTVDQFVAALRSGREPADMMDRLGIPIIATMRVHYFLADGVASQSIIGTNKALTVRRDSTKEKIVIQQPVGGDGRSAQQP